MHLANCPWCDTCFSLAPLRSNRRDSIATRVTTVRQRLLVSHADPSDRLIDREGHPVWPLTSDGDYEALARLAHFVGCELVEMRARLGEAPVGPDAELIIGVGGGVDVS